MEQKAEMQSRSWLRTEMRRKRRTERRRRRRLVRSMKKKRGDHLGTRASRE
jgi:hypothetical protein